MTPDVFVRKIIHQKVIDEFCGQARTPCSSHLGELEIYNGVRQISKACSKDLLVAVNNLVSGRMGQLTMGAMTEVNCLLLSLCRCHRTMLRNFEVSAHLLETPGLVSSFSNNAEQMLMLMALIAN